METKPGELGADIFWGEHATAYHVKNRGLVVIPSCGHAGIINSIRQLQKATGIDKVHAVVGGWHLAPYPDDIVAKTVEAFKQINPDYLIPMHCTGFNTITAIQREMPTKLIMPSSGTTGRLRCVARISVAPEGWEATLAPWLSGAAKDLPDPR